MDARLLLIATLALTATQVAAEPLALTFQGPATLIGQRAAAPDRYGVAIAAFDGKVVPTRTVEGVMDQRAFRLDGIRGNTLSLMQPLQAQLEKAGYAVLFDCDTTVCGGFDFRFAIDVLPEPQMHVDLGDFHYLAAQNAKGDVVVLLISRASDQGFVQVTSVTTGPDPVVVAAPEVTAAPSEPAPIAPQIEPQVAAPPGSLDERLLTTGSVALDDLVFASGKAVLADQTYASLAALGAWLIAHPDMTVTVVGHTDASGSLAGNVALSKQRAAAVRDVLIATYGVPRGQIDAQGAGYLAPRATNQTPEGRQINRRVEVMLTSTP